MSGGRGAFDFFRERAEDTADALQDMLERSGTGVHLPGLAALGTTSGSRRHDKYLDTGMDKVSQIGPQLASTNPSTQIEGLRRVVALISKGRDASSFLPGALKLTSSPSLEVRRLVYVVILQYAQHSPEAEELTLLSINSFQRDATDPSPLVRGMAIRVLTGLRNRMANSIVELSVSKAARDTSAYVRKVTALALPRCIDADADNLESYLSTLSSLLGDRSPVVIGAALVSFQRIYGALFEPVDDEDEQATRRKAFEQRWELLHVQYRRICHALPDLEEWSQVVACEILLHYARANFELPNDLSDSTTTSVALGKKARSQRDDDLDLLTYKVTQLLHSTNASVVLSASRTLYYLLPPSDHNRFVTQLAALATGGTVEDRDVMYILLINLLWLLQSPHRQTYTVALTPLTPDFWPRSDCSVSASAPGSLALIPPAAVASGSEGSGAASLANTNPSLAVGLGNLGALGQLGNLGNLQLGNFSSLGLTGTNISTAVSNALTGTGDAPSGTGAPNAFHLSTTTLAGSTATEPIFAAKLEILARLANPDNLAWLVDELEDVIRYEWHESRAMHALKVLADLVVRWGGPNALEINGQFESDNWGVEARVAELALGLLRDIQGGAPQQRGRDVSDPFDRPPTPTPLRPGVTLGAVRLLAQVLSSKNRTLVTLQNQSSEVGTARDEIQTDMFELLQHALRLLYTSSDPASAPAGKRIKLVGKRNVSGGVERHTLASMLGECCRVEVEVAYAAPDATEPVRTRKSAAELLGPELLSKAAKNWSKEPTQTRLALITAAVKVWAHLQAVNAAVGGVHPIAPVQVDTHTHHLLQQAWTDPNLDLHAHVESYVALVRSAAAWVAADQQAHPSTTAQPCTDPVPTESPGEQPASDEALQPAPTTEQSNNHSSAPPPAACISPATLVQTLFLSNDQPTDSTISQTIEFGSLALALGNREIFGSNYMRVPPWAAPGQGITKAQRDQIMDKAKAALDNAQSNGMAPSKSAPTASAYEYVPDESQLVDASASPVAMEPFKGRKDVTTRTSTPDTATPTASFADRMNPKYQDLDSFLDDTDDVYIASSVPLSGQFNQLDLMGARAPQDDEYYTDSDAEEAQQGLPKEEPEFEDDDTGSSSSESEPEPEAQRQPLLQSIPTPGLDPRSLEAATVDAAVGSGGWAGEPELDSDDYESEHDDEPEPPSTSGGATSWSTGLEDNAWRNPSAAAGLAAEAENNAWAS